MTDQPMTGRPGHGLDPYQVLGIAPGASTDEIARAYRRLARGLHPDSRPADADAAERFRAVCDAYELLSDPARRASHDAQNVVRTRSERPGASARWGAEPPLWAGPVHIEADAGARPRDGGDRDDVELLLERLLRGLRSWPW